MLKSEVLLQIRSLTLNYELQLQNDVKDLILSTILGNPDGIRYQLLDTPKKLDEIPYINYFTLRKDGSVYLVMALCERNTFLGNQSINSLYVRYVTFNPLLSSNSAQIKSEDRIQHRMGNSLLKRGMRKFAETFAFDQNSGFTNSNKRAYYAYIEETNIRSLNFTMFLMERIRRFSITTYSKFYPRKNIDASKITESELDYLIARLKESYKEHSFFFIDKERLRNNYYVIRKDGQIIAGLLAEKVNWKIEQVPGTFGKILKNILPYLPVFNRLINSKRFTFLSFDTLICDTGEDHALLSLFESVCAMHKVYSAFIYSDSDEPMAHRVNKLPKMGLLNKFYKNAQGAIVAGFINYTDLEKEQFKKSPVYVSGYDLT